MIARAFIVALLLSPFAVAAQSDELRAQIRADLMQDPRTAALPAPELDALVAALANEAETSGAAATYLDAKTAPTFTYDPPPVSDEHPLTLILSTPIMVAICALLAGIAGVVLIMFRRRHQPEAPVPVA